MNTKELDGYLKFLSEKQTDSHFRSIVLSEH